MGVFCSIKMFDNIFVSARTVVEKIVAQRLQNFFHPIGAANWMETGPDGPYGTTGTFPGGPFGLRARLVVLLEIKISLSLIDPCL